MTQTCAMMVGVVRYHLFEVLVCCVMGLVLCIQVTAKNPGLKLRISQKGVDYGVYDSSISYITCTCALIDLNYFLFRIYIGPGALVTDTFPVCKCIWHFILNICKYNIPVCIIYL